MNQPTGVLTSPRRNPRRGTGIPRHNYFHDRQARTPSPSASAPASASASAAASAPPKRVTRSTTTHKFRYTADSCTANQDNSSATSDDSDNDSDTSTAAFASDGLFTRPRQSRRYGPQKTIASTRERRHRDAHNSSSRARISTPPSTTRSTRQATRPKASAALTLKKKASPASKKSTSPHHPEWPSSRVIPPWRDLEWTILVQIFEYASYPVHQRSNVRWLLSAGLSCKAFLDPALKALYKSAMPQLISTNMSNKYANLIRKLAAEPEAALQRQDHRRTMVESLVIEVSSLPHSQNPNFDIAELIHSLPRLCHIELFHEFDLPPYRKLDSKAKKWTYSVELIDALRSAGDAEGALRLKSWTWSERLLTPSLVRDMRQIHGWATFSQLRKLALVNFQVPSLQTLKEKDIDDPAILAKDNDYIALVAASLQSVENLQHLVLESSTVVDGQFLSLLPKTINRLEIKNCWEVTAEMLAEYLVTHGSKLRQLTLHNNQSLSLSFLPLFGEYCPELRELRIDLLTYSHHEFYNDSGPIYDKLLTVDDVPVWPKKLEVIDLEQLAKWDAETAEMFFQSFVDQAPDLSHLRYLAVKAMLDVPWRQRSEFRDKWVRKLKKVFLRRAEKPRPFHSLIQWPLSGDEHPTNRKVQLNKVKQGAEMSSPRRSTRRSIAPAVFVPGPVVCTGTGSARKRKRSSAVATRDLRRSNKRVGISYRDPDTDEDLDLDESSSEDDVEREGDSPAMSSPASPLTPAMEAETFIHGLCDVVNIRFDNQKPREFQWGAEDFLDDDLSESGDAEWTSDRELDEDSEAMAW
ncbi:unnamed protein product [Discula destructiva]